MASTNKRKAEGTGTAIRNVRRKAADAPKSPGALINVTVGKGSGQKTLSVPGDLVKAHSEFFQAALAKEWKQSQTRVVLLLDDQPEIFELFYHFMKTGQIFSAKDGDTYRNDGGVLLDDEYVRLIDAWRLADKLVSTTFKDAVTDALAAKVAGEDGYPYQIHVLLYPISKDSSAIRRLLADLAVWLWTDAQIEEEADPLVCLDFSKDVMRALTRIRKIGTLAEAPWEVDGKACEYHDHVADGKACYRTMFQS